MPGVKEVRVPIEGKDGSVRGHVVLRLLPNTGPSVPPLLLDYRTVGGVRANGGLQTGDGPAGMPPIQLLEGAEYHYKFQLRADDLRGPVSTDRPEVMWPDDESGIAGRLRPGLYTGTLPVTVFAVGEPVGQFVVEVRSRKLDYLTHYEWMLSDLADTFAELIMRSFGPTETRFSPASDADAPTLYQRFAFLKSMLSGPSFDSAIQQVIHRPHQQWEHEEQMRSVGQSIPADSRVARALARGGRRVSWQGGPLEDAFKHTAVRSLPSHIPVVRTHETEDTIPNRFVKYALGRWRETVAEIADVLHDAGDGPAADRGRRETAAVLLQLDELLSQPLFRRVGTLTHLPADNQVLQKRAGYRELYRLYVQFELAALLSWSGGEDVYGAGQKDVAVLYEYWVFLQLSQAVSELCSEPLPLEKMLRVDRHGLDVRLRQGMRKVLKGRVRRLGRDLDVELWYNRTFPRRDDGRDGSSSWTQALRPDCSLKIAGPGYDGAVNEIWIHFDAKYRLDSVREVFGEFESGDAGSEPGVSEAGGLRDLVVGPVTEDLLKMHAYRDAIRRSSGAYVVYPGSELELRRRYHEILPGLGAFALIPSEESQAQGLTAVRGFIDDVLHHFALQISDDERHRYWERRIYELPLASAHAKPVGAGPGHAPVVRRGEFVEAAPFLRRPPADTVVLLGYVRSREHYEWIRNEGLYNMRADERTGRVGLGSAQLAAEFIMLYGPALTKAQLWHVTGDPRLLTRERLLELGYPGPGGQLYYCLPTAPVPAGVNPLQWNYAIVRRVIEELAPGAEYGEPVAATWDALVTFGGRSTGGRF